MAKRERTKDIYVDPMFYVPPGVEFKTKKEVPGGTEPEDPDNLDAFTGAPGDIGGADPGPGGALATPTTFTVVEQIVRITTNGQAVVDLVVEVGDVPGATNYEFRVTAI